MAAMSSWLTPGLSLPQMQANPAAVYNPWAPFQAAPPAAAAPAAAAGGKKGKKGGAAPAAQQSALEIASNEAAAEGL
jgi:hypothetical protein